MIRFALQDLEHAAATWRCSCGPASLAAICGLTLEEARRHFPGFRGWTNVTAMREALKSARRRFSIAHPHRVASGPSWPRYGLARIQFEGPWTQPGANPRWAYKHTHWVGVEHRIGEVEVTVIWDVNHVDEAIPGHTTGCDGWALAEWWALSTVPYLTADIPRASGGWHVTHAIEVERC